MNYAKRKDQLDHILKDESYWVNDNGYKSFVADMHNKVSKGYSLSEKQETAITNVVKAYAKYFFMNNDSDYKKKVNEKIEKVGMIKQLLNQCDYHTTYRSSAQDFLNSVEGQIKSRGSLSPKQRTALNKMYKRFKKRIEKSA